MNWLLIIIFCLCAATILNTVGLCLLLWRQHQFVYVTGRLLDRIRTLEKLSQESRDGR